jgi:WLM domain/PUB domain/UBA/TS-N domain
MFSIRQTLAHELAHNDISPHSNKFYELMRSVERQAHELDWTQSKGQTARDLVGSSHLQLVVAPEGRDPLDVDEPHNQALVSHGHVLGSAPGFSSDSTSRLVPTEDSGPHGHSAPSDTVTSSSSPLVSTPAVARDVQASDDSTTTVKTVVDAAVTGMPVDLNTADTAVAEIAVPQQPQPPQPPQPRPTGEEALMALGFEQVLARMALRECDGSVSRAGEWLLMLQTNESEHYTAVPGESVDAVHLGRLQDATAKLEREVSGQDDIVTVLATLHAYVLNLLKHPDNPRFRSINGKNAACRRVTRFLAGQRILQALGFTRQEDDRWELSSADSAKLWIAKSVIVSHVARLIIITGQVCA